MTMRAIYHVELKDVELGDGDFVLSTLGMNCIIKVSQSFCIMKQSDRGNQSVKYSMF